MVAAIVAKKWPIVLSLALFALAMAVVLPLTVFAADGDVKVLIRAKKTIAVNTTLVVKLQGAGVDGFGQGACVTDITGAAKQKSSGVTRAVDILSVRQSSAGRLDLFSDNTCTSLSILIAYLNQDPVVIQSLASGGLFSHNFTAGPDQLNLQFVVK